jgi:2-succinyl-6-hydroxy-2,4-cyclohexadiene-1-carboxylate synthase
MNSSIITRSGANVLFVNSMVLKSLTEPQKTPLILLHGFAQTPQSWQTTIDQFSDDRPVHAIELLGHGKTGLSLGEPSVEMVRDYVVSEIDRLVGGPAAVWGYSQGGRVAYDLVLNAPDRVSFLVIESAAPGIEDPIARADRRSRDFALASRIEAGSIEDFVDLWERIPALDGQTEEMIQQQRPDRLAQDPVALAAALRGIGQAAYEPMWDRLGEIKVKAMFFAGALDPIYEGLTYKASQLTGGEVVPAIFDQVGHAVHLANPKGTANYVESVLEDYLS